MQMASQTKGFFLVFALAYICFPACFFVFSYSFVMCLLLHVYCSFAWSIYNFYLNEILQNLVEVQEINK